MLPFLVPILTQANVLLNNWSLKRLSAFLQLYEIDPDNLETREQPASGRYYSDVNIK